MKEKTARRVDNLFSRKMLGSVLVGKFIGDYAALTMENTFGMHVGYILGIILTVLLFIYWERIERNIEDKLDEDS